MSRYQIHQGDVLEVLRTLPDNYFDAVLSDPPYGISFMGKEWDKGVPSMEVYAEMLRVCKPGALGLHFGGTRMWHRLAVNLEDAGFNIRDTLMWLYGSGFPKSLNISKAVGKSDGEGATAWQGHGTQLKPGWEPCLLVQKPLAGTFVKNVTEHGCGSLNLDGCRVGDDVISVHNAPKGTFAGAELGRGSDTTSYTAHTGRHPANVILDETFEQEPWARYFYNAKVSTKERNAGCEALTDKDWSADGAAIPERADRPFKPSKNNHPTLKPLALTEYLAKLLLPAALPGKTRRILVPFSGSGSEMIGCLKAGWDEVQGIELSPDYIQIAHARVAHHTEAQHLAEVATHTINHNAT